MPNQHLVTTILITYDRPHLLKESVAALLRQTHTNLEIILINNGGTGETAEYLNEVAAADSRVKLMHYEENQWSPDDHQKYIRICLNEALQEATGDYVWFNADDDFIADDYLEKMVSLFEGNPECTTAAGIPVGIDIDGNRYEPGPRTTNFRPRYMPGHEMVLRSLRGEKEIFGSPGYNFTVKRDVLIQAGGYHPSIENGERYGIVPFGVTGFDETAIFYFRRHAGQWHETLSPAGRLGIDESLALITDWDLRGRWQVFGADVATEVVAMFEKRVCAGAASWFMRLLYSWRFPGAIRIFRKMWNSRWFWAQLPASATEPQWIKQVVQVPFRESGKFGLRVVFRLVPHIEKISPRFDELKQRINHKGFDR